LDLLLFGFLVADAKWRRNTPETFCHRPLVQNKHNGVPVGIRTPVTAACSSYALLNFGFGLRLSAFISGFQYRSMLTVYGSGAR
jgi:hypothetical protein